MSIERLLDIIHHTFEADGVIVCVVERALSPVEEADVRACSYASNLQFVAGRSSFDVDVSKMRHKRPAVLLKLRAIR